MKQIIRKLLSIPVPEKPKIVKAAELWEVKWTSRDGEYSGSVEPAMEVLTSEADAQAFADALRAAFKLLQHTGKGTEVSMRKRP